MDDNDLLFAVTLRSGHPRSGDWSSPMRTTGTARCSCRTIGASGDTLTLNLGLRYEVDTDVKNIGRYDEINPIVRPFLRAPRQQT